MDFNQLNFEYRNLMQLAATSQDSKEAKEYLSKAEKIKAALDYATPSDRYSRWCGGPGGFDDFMERVHE